jgi:hypothetical protein
MKERCLLFIFVFLLPCFLFSWPDEKVSAEKKGDKKKNRFVILPLVFYTPLTGIAGGAGGVYYWRTLEDISKESPSTILMDFIYTQKDQIVCEVTPHLFLQGGTFHLVGYLGLKRFAEKFYGIGPLSSEDMEEDYSYRSAKLGLSLRRRLTTKLYFGLQYDFEYFDPMEFKTGGILDSGSVVGRNGGRVSGLGLIFVRDGRDDIFFPTNGLFFQASATIFVKQLGSEYIFQKFNIDLRQYVSLFSNHVLAFQESINSTSGSVPFQWLPALGGPWVMRGYILGRFRDKNMFHIQMEYRLPLAWRLGVVGFLGYGGVADKMSRIKLSDLKLTGGCGIRYQLNRDATMNVRLDFGFAKGSFGVYAMINEAF